MASIKSQMTLTDGMSAVLRRITGNMNALNSSFTDVQQATAEAMQVKTFEATNSAIDKQVDLAQQLAQGYDTAADQAERFNSTLQAGNGPANGLLTKIKGIATAAAAGFGLQKMVGLSDDLASGRARLSLIVDDGGSVSALEQKIMASAMRSRAAYLDTMSTVAKLGLVAGNAFSSNDELIGFTELVNKNLVIGGASAVEQASAMYQLTQAMGSGRLQGDEYRSIIENAPLLANAIEDYMRNVQKAEGSMKDWASDGLLTAGVIKAALFTSADEIESRFAQMPMTWGQVWTLMGNIALRALDPILTAINWLANNIEIVGPIVLGIAGAFAIYALAAHGASFATKVWTGAQAAFNAVMALNPIFLIIMGIVLLIAILYAVVATINKVTGSSISATGLIAGAFMWLMALIGNIVIGTLNAIIQFVWALFVEPFLGIIEWILNVCNGGFNSFGDAVANLIGQIISWFLSLGKVVTKIIDAIFGTNWTAGLSSLQDSVLAWGKNETAITLDRNAPTIDHRFDMTNAFDMGNEFGKGVEDKIGGFFNLGDDAAAGLDFGSMVGDIGSIADDTGGIADAMDISNEQLEYLRDIAERDAINRFTTAEVKIDLTGMTNRIEGGADLDGLLSTLTDGFTDALLTAAEGVHA